MLVRQCVRPAIRGPRTRPRPQENRVMHTYSRSHLSDQDLLRNLKEHVGHERSATAEVLADLAEADERKLYLPLGHASMYSYCVETLSYSEEAAYRRIQAAGAARRFPAIFAALADGRLHLTAVNLLAPQLTPENAADLLAAAAHQTKARIEWLIAERFPRPDAPSRLEALAPAPGTPPGPGTGSEPS